MYIRNNFQIRLFLVSVILSILSISNAILVGPLKRPSSAINLCKEAGMFALTFDQGPSIYTGAVLDALDQHKVKATFHPVVNFLDEVTIVANLQRAAQAGHLIGLSIETDLDIGAMKDDEFISIVDSRAALIQSVIGYKPKFLRIPQQTNISNDQINLINTKGYTVTTYNLDSYDYCAKTADDVVWSFNRILNTLSNNTKGAFISVQRDNLAVSVDATAKIIGMILEKNYKLVTLDNCVGISPDWKNSNGRNGTIPKISNPSSPNQDQNVSSDGEGLRITTWAILSILLYHCTKNSLF